MCKMKKTKHLQIGIIGIIRQNKVCYLWALFFMIRYRNRYWRSCSKCWEAWNIPCPIVPCPRKIRIFLNNKDALLICHMTMSMLFFCETCFQINQHLHCDLHCQWCFFKSLLWALHRLDKIKVIFLLVIVLTILNIL